MTDDRMYHFCKDCQRKIGGYWAKDFQGIELEKVCKLCKKEKLSKYRPEILSRYNQNDVREDIEAE